MNSQSALVLGKWLAVLAWADGKFDAEEKGVLHNFFGSQTSLSSMDCLGISLYAEYPVSEEEKSSIMVQVSSHFKDMVSQELLDHWQNQMLISSRGEDSSKVLLIKQLDSGRFGGSPNNSILPREQKLGEFLNNPVYYRVHWNRPELLKRVDLPVLEKACLEFALIARVAQADEVLHDDEKAVILDILSVSMDLDMEGLANIFEIALNIEAAVFNTQRIVQRYAECTSVSERKTFLELLLEVIIADGEVHPFEKDILVDIAKNLGIGQANITSGLERIERAVNATKSSQSSN